MEETRRAYRERDSMWQQRRQQFGPQSGSQFGPGFGPGFIPQVPQMGIPQRGQQQNIGAPQFGPQFGPGFGNNSYNPNRSR